MDAAEGGVGGLPDLCSAGVGREDGAGDVVGADVVDHPALDQRDGVPAVPHILPQERSRGLVVFGDNLLQLQTLSRFASNLVLKNPHHLSKGGKHKRP